MVDIRVLGEEDYRAADKLFLTALHIAPTSDQDWEWARNGFETGQVIGAFDGDLLAGTALWYSMEMVVPGGAVCPMAGVSRVGVRMDRTRRGILTAMMRRQLDMLAAAGIPMATLRATEHGIYRRFGYGVASRGRDLAVNLRRARWRPDGPEHGEVRLLAADEISTVLPAVYGRVGLNRPGTGTRPQHWWDGSVRRGTSGALAAAVYSGSDGDEGFVLWSPERDPREDARLEVRDLVAPNHRVHAGLWRFLLAADLVGSIKASRQPLDDVVDLLVTDSRAVKTTAAEDEIWLRLVDIPATLAARTYRDADPVVIEVVDDLLPVNSGCYRLAPDGASRVDTEPALRLAASELATLYLGDRAPSTLASVGRLEVLDPDALPHADELLRTDQAPWSGTYF